jgi:hypothetical protein
MNRSLPHQLPKVALARWMSFSIAPIPNTTCVVIFSYLSQSKSIGIVFVHGVKTELD